MLFNWYPGCITCQKAKKWLDEQNLPYTARHIRDEKPSLEELTAWYRRSGLPLKRFFNTSGKLYAEYGLKDKLAAMSEAEQLALLASDGMLIKRPILVTEDRVLVGFKSAEWAGALLKYGSSMDNYADERDFRLLEQDRYTFAVLSRILAGPCAITLTDHERLILCHSTAPYPVWIWTADALSEAEIQRAWEIADAACPLAQGHSYNLKYELAEAFIARARAQGLNTHITTNMLAYDCPSLITPIQSACGHLHRCTTDDTEAVAAMIHEFHASVGDTRFDIDTCRSIAAHHIAGHFYFWKDAHGETVSCCSWQASNGLASVGSVYTIPEHRRKHYAQQLVYEVTRIVADSGLTPMLYTDADYTASNACYEKIGYVRRGRLCTIGS